MRKAQRGEMDHPVITRYRGRFDGSASGESLSFAEAKEIFDALVKLNGRLHRIARISDSFQSQLRQMEEERERLYDDVQRANNAKSEFLANMSHEIRTPLNAIVGLSHLALRSRLTEQQADYVGKIRAAARMLLGLVNDILDLSKVEAGKLELERVPFRIDQLFDGVASVVALHAEEKGLPIRFSIDPEVPRALVGDPLRLSQILTNLAGNAVKFTESGEVEVAAEMASRAPGRVWVRLVVRDTGIGFAPEERERLFEAFTQGDGSTSRKHGGTGLGLTITERLVQMMGGEIHVESAPGVGSTFAVTLPLSLAAEDALLPTGPERAAVSSLSGARVLVAEDNSINQQVVREILEALGAAVEVAPDGRAAVERLSQGGAHFDVVLMDVQMPEMDGYEATRAIRALPRLAGIPIIAMTAHALESERRKCLDAGMNDHVAKPIEPDTLPAVVARWVAARPSAEGPATPAPEPHLLPGVPVAIPGIDPNSSLMRTWARKGRLMPLLREFGRSSSEIAADLEDALAAGDLKRARNLTHSLRGAAATLSAREVAAAAGALEQALAEGTADAPARFEAMQAALAPILEGLAHLPPEEGAEPPDLEPPGDPAQLAPLLVELDALLNESDMEAAERFRALHPRLAAAGQPALAAELAERMARYDFDAARASLAALAQSLGVALPGAE